MNTVAYALFTPFIGLVVHLDSGATICLHCRKAFLLSSIVAHFMTAHKLASFIKKYNNVTTNDDLKIIPDRMQSQLIELGAKQYTDIGFYGSPTQDALPVIDVLKVEKGFMCTQCPVSGETSTAYFSPVMATMNNHFSKCHGKMGDEKYIPCYIQHLYGDRGHLKYFRVKNFHKGPTVSSTITDLGQERYNTFLQSNPDYCSSKKPSTMVPDHRVQSLFYTKVHWYGLTKVKNCDYIRLVIVQLLTQCSSLFNNRWLLGKIVLPIGFYCMIG